MTPVEHARNYIAGRIFDPVFAHPDAPQKIKDVIAASKRWVDNLDCVGDIYNYMQHVTDRSDASALELFDLGLDSYEMIIKEYAEKFAPYIDQRTTLDDFIVGQQYSGWKINGVAKKYDMRSGGILTVGQEPDHAAVLIKVNLSGGDYPNEWLQPHETLKYYLKATKRKGAAVFSEQRSENRAIINYPNVPVYVFARPTPDGIYDFHGLFSCAGVHTEGDKKWFQLQRKEEIGAPILFDQFLTEQAEAVARASAIPADERGRRRASATTKSKKIVTITVQYSRNPYVIADVLERAAGICEECGSDAPFSRASDGTPYLEVHHKVRLADDGDDTVENAIALCPNCHRKSHYG